ncbi:crotonase/enoyl-CoA hydratase family protein [Marinicauda sp. Alg238-R41]|uniref:crotonase/enoyl-CoA hydratase family protein n=1 Tax=Marinicauda sp. Alg238-R41 TaxID=2993447 RepID=UPI0022E272F4|nr:crotonase/enoyl-CoA hydratase family protein [Marinicauda sp. Alg238-R41]
MTVHYEIRDRVAVITLDRPEARNAVDGPTARALVDAFERFESDDGADIAILTGAGGTFCAGADLKAIGTDNMNRVEETGDGPMGPTRMRLSKPVIAAIEGHAVAGGLELALWCDLRVAAKSAVFGVFCRRFGVPLIDGGTIRLPRLIGQSRAMDMILTGRAVEADEALQIGLANRVCETGEALSCALDLAGRIAGFPARCMRNDRMSVLEQWPLDEAGALVNETRRGLDTLASGETLEGAMRFTGGEGRGGQF